MSTPGIIRGLLSLLLVLIVLIAGFFLTPSTDLTAGDRIPPIGGVGPPEPVPEPALTLYIQSVAPFTTTSQVAPLTLKLPKLTDVVFFASTNVPVHDFVWTGATVLDQAAHSSSVHASFRKKGAYTVSVTPNLLLVDGSIQPRPDKAKSITIEVTNDRASRVGIAITDPVSSPMMGYAWENFLCHAKTSPPGYEHLIEWTGGGFPSSGFGPQFSTSYHSKGKYTLKAGPSSALAIEIYNVASIRRDSPFGQAVWYGYPITFTAVTDPRGYEAYVPWRVDTHGDMHTRAVPPAGTGASFTTTFYPTMDGGSFWAQVYAADFPVLQMTDPCHVDSDCDDGNRCTDDSCDTGSGGICVHTSVVCSALDACHNAGICSADTGCSNPVKSCDDGIGCTADSCDAVIGCVHTPDAGVCNDNNPCTADSCEPATGCVHRNVCAAPGTGQEELISAPYRPPAPDGDDDGLVASTFEGNFRENPGNCPDVWSTSIPVGLSNGEVKIRVVDLSVPSRGFPFQWVRSYSSRQTFSGPSGFNWEISYHRRVFPADSTTVSIINGVGREDLYQSAGGSRYTSPAAIYDNLVKNGDNTYTQTDPAGMRFDYDVDGYLTAMTDRTGNSLTIQRNSFHNITQIIDTQGRLYTIAYTDGTASQKIASISDFAGRQVLYTYDANADLIRVRRPVVTGTPNGNNFCDPSPSADCPQPRKTTLYTYSSGSSNMKLNHNLLTIVEPAYNLSDDPAQSKAMVTLTYSTTTDPILVDFDQVVSERWGHDQGGPPPNPNVVVGGTKTFAYTQNLSGDSDAPPGAIQRTTETDSNGNVRDHYFNASRLEIKTIIRTNRNVRPGKPGEPDYVTSYTYTPEGLITSRTVPRGNGVAYLYDSANPRRESQQNLLEERRMSNGIAGGGVDLVTRFTYDPVFNQRRTVTDPRSFPTGTVPLDANGHLDLTNAQVARYTTTAFFDYQETTGFQTSKGIATTERIPEGLGDLNSATDFNEGNVVKIAHPTIQTSGPNTGQVIAELMTYNDLGQTLTRADPEGHLTRYVYFPTNGVLNDPSDREGYLQSVTRDFGGFNLVTQYEYDTPGNVTRVIDPKGQDTLYTVNALNQAVRMQSRLVFGSARYQVDTFFDANDNVVRTERQNIKEQQTPSDPGTPYAHNPLVDTFEFDILHDLVAQNLDRSLNDNAQTGTVRTEYFYDANLNRKAIKLPLAVSGSVPANIITTLYDERDLPYKVTTGDSDTDPANMPPGSAVVVTTNYDPNGNTLETIDGIRDAQHTFAPTTTFPGSAPGDVIKRDYDGFDRLTKTTDGEGNEHGTSYDLASNAIQTILRGPVDHTTGAAFALLMQTDVTFDELNRVAQGDTRHFDTKTGINIGDGHRITQQRYDRDSKVTEVTDDRGLRTTTQWDTADRRFKVVDALANEVEYGYDANSNVTTMTRRDISTDIGTSTQTFVTTHTYDGIDRLIKTVDPAGDVNEVSYDSRDNVVRTSDALRGTGQPTGPGNIVKKDFDGLNRMVKTERILTSNGRGDTAQTSIITTRQAWDDDSRLTSQTDDNNHPTGYTYDALNRLTVITYADMTTRMTQFDTDNHVTQWTDQNLTTVDMAYDGSDRLLSRAVTIPAGSSVIGSTSETFGYDGGSRTTHTTNDDGIIGTMTCDFEYDSLSNRTKDLQGSLSVDSVFDGVSNRIQVTYPGQFGGGRRVITSSFDNLNRLQAISDVGGAIATMHYKGPERLERRTYGVDSSPISKLDSAYDALPRLVDVNHTTGAGAPIARFQYGYDRMHHRLFEKRVHDSNVGDVYRYDSIYRVVRNSQNANLSAVAPGTEIDPDAYSAAPDRIEYAFDGVGNRTTSTKVALGTPTVTTYTQTPDGTLKDAEVNQYTSTQEDSLPVQNYTYDSNGNLTSDGSKTYAYDFKNRMVEVRNQGTTTLVAQYSYDAFDRRGMKILPSGTTHYLFDGIEVVEERDGSNATARQYVWGNGIDQLLQEKTATTIYHSHENSIGSIAAMTNSSGTVVERYQYDPFGNTTVTLDGVTGNRYRFQGAYLDDETGFYFMRARSYIPSLGRFAQRDPIGIWTDEINLGNGYTFVGNDAVNGKDPLGIITVVAGPSGARVTTPSGTTIPLNPGESVEVPSDSKVDDLVRAPGTGAELDDPTRMDWGKVGTATWKGVKEGMGGAFKDILEGILKADPGPIISAPRKIVEGAALSSVREVERQVANTVTVGLENAFGITEGKRQRKNWEEAHRGEIEAAEEMNRRYQAAAAEDRARREAEAAREERSRRYWDRFLTPIRVPKANCPSPPPQHPVPPPARTGQE